MYGASPSDSKIAENEVVLEAVISSGLVQRLLSRVGLVDLQRLENVNTALRQLTDSLAQSDWTAACARLVPASHYLTTTAAGGSRAAQVQAVRLAASHG